MRLIPWIARQLRELFGRDARVRIVPPPGRPPWTPSVRRDEVPRSDVRYEPKQFRRRM